MINKLEIGCGDRPTEGYLHQDIRSNLMDLDFNCDPWQIDLPKNSLSEVIAVGVMEHLRYEEFRKTVRHVHFLLKPSGIFLFDVPDLLVWSQYLYKVLRGKKVPFSKEHILATMYGWQRWLGDEHKSGWTCNDIYLELEFGFYTIIEKHHSTDFLAIEYKKRKIFRNRFDRPKDAHIYVKAVKR